MFTLGPGEMVAIFILALVLFGPKELPKIGRTIGKLMSDFRRAQAELKSTFDREMRNLEREAGIKELTATTFSDSYNYDQSSYDSSYYEAASDSHTADGASATQGAGSTATLQIEAAAGSIASGHLESGPIEQTWDPYIPAPSAPAENGHPLHESEAVENTVHS